MIPTPPATKLTRRQRIAHAALVELQREAAALERRIRRELAEAKGSEPVALDCEHCGWPAIESPTNEFFDGDGDRCMTCSWPGWVSADGEIEEGAYWVCADEGRCSLDDCEECRGAELKGVRHA